MTSYHLVTEHLPTAVDMKMKSTNFLVTGDGNWYRKSADEVALGDHANCGYDSHAEKVEHQYEDGEIRGWGEDKGEIECVDYGSDSREMDVETDDGQIDNVEFRKTGILDAGYANLEEAGSNTQNARPQTFTQGTSVKDIWGTDTGRHRGSAMILTNETKKYNEFSERSDRARRTFYSNSFGQDQWPKDCTRFRDGMDPANKYRRIPVSVDFTRLGPKNAFLTAAANLERNGFVVAHDGTILRADNGRRAPQCANASSQRSNYSVSRRPPIDKGGSFGVRVHGNLRGMSPDRHTNISRLRTDKDGRGVVRTRRREKYHTDGPNREVFYRTGRNFSPQRRPLHLSRPQNRSSSSSRSRSRMWTHPRESIDHGRQRSTSPYMESEVRVERRRSQMQERSSTSQIRPGFKCTTGYAPSVRNHDSRWPDERSVSPDRFKEHQYQRSQERRHTPGISQVQKLDCSETPERLRPDKGYHPMRSGRFPDSVAARDSRHLTSKCDFDGAAGDLKNDIEDGPGTVCEEHEFPRTQVSNPGGKVSVLQSTL